MWNKIFALTSEPIEYVGFFLKHIDGKKAIPHGMMREKPHFDLSQSNEPYDGTKTDAQVDILWYINL